MKMLLMLLVHTTQKVNRQCELMSLEYEETRTKKEHITPFFVSFDAMMK